jgi:pimeloyl-ACP methyl ester carboxylesterase
VLHNVRVPLLRSDDGVDLFHRRVGPGSGIPVLLHHGFGADGDLDWGATGVEAALVAAGRSLVVLDARGHGRSGKPHDPARYGEPRMARDVTNLLDALGLDRVDLVGYSMGGVVALLTAVGEPRVRRLVVGGIGAGAVEAGGVDTSVLPPEVLRAALLTDDPDSIEHPAAAGFRRFTERPGVDRLALAAQAASVHRARIPLGEIRASTLVLAGRRDDLAARPEVLAAAIPAARLRLVGGDHGGALQAPEFARAIVEFLGSGSAAGE